MGYNLTQINPAYELVSEVIVSSATTSVDFTGLNFGKEDDLILVSAIVNSTASTPAYNIYFNNNTTTTNYYMQYLIANSTTISAGRTNTTESISLNANKFLLNSSKIKLTNNGYIIVQSNTNREYATSGLYMGLFGTSSTFTASSITQLTLTASVSNAIGIGSRFQLYKRVAPIVFDYEVTGSAVTSVDITGLNIDKGSEYQLVVTTVNSGATKMYVNGNTTDTNYYRQSLLSASTSVSSGRDNNPYINNYGGTNLFVVKLKLTNNGYYVWQTDSSTNIGGSSILIDNVYGTSTFTMSSITSLSLVNSTFAVGSRFQLIKLK